MQSNSIVCRVCGEASDFLCTGNLLGNPVRYFECPSCEYVQTEQPYWLDKAYASAITSADTGIMTRNISNAKIVISTLLVLGRIHSKVLDYAGGHGILVRLLRDYGVDALWSDRYCTNLVARGFEHNNESVGLVTAFEAFEHFTDPCHELDRMLMASSSVIISTLLIPKPTPNPAEWWYYGLEHGQHIGFFRSTTLMKIAADRGMRFYTNGSDYHVITKEKFNGVLWRMAIRWRFLAPLLCKPFLKSLTWVDHLQFLRK
ncbi:class I SAM-dependent methyltransferase [Rhodanobacter sp. FDAARGOS 1247]|jgi:hypothetical protein|uniref:class I SAM-dependent methyltransferase n=1 Tax=Rhodanobacter sp. FDAARGOS 1247 TaxID=2778082 RepID=UPI001951F238|nr:class I SAM-dependent methyltransferase [Rhodanobacter sp. FDAARGOS 1247]QRP64725.1 class I SAM-dependent methyltransferase [Rhodanobacter sp. FDAARGOS 1247]